MVINVDIAAMEIIARQKDMEKDAVALVRSKNLQQLKHCSIN